MRPLPSVRSSQWGLAPHLHTVSWTAATDMICQWLRSLGMRKSRAKVASKSSASNVQVAQQHVEMRRKPKYTSCASNPKGGPVELVSALLCPREYTRATVASLLRALQILHFLPLQV
eukprot:6125915-Amphidinium_carterae.2